MKTTNKRCQVLTLKVHLIRDVFLARLVNLERPFVETISKYILVFHKILVYAFILSVLILKIIENKAVAIFFPFKELDCSSTDEQFECFCINPKVYKSFHYFAKLINEIDL